MYAVKNLEGEEGEPVHVGGKKHASLRNPDQEVNIQCKHVTMFVCLC